jgi:hypothetical protein
LNTNGYHFAVLINVVGLPVAQVLDALLECEVVAPGGVRAS